MLTLPLKYQPMYPVGPDRTEYESITSDYVYTVDYNGHQTLQVEPEALRIFVERAMHNATFHLRPAHQEQVASILPNPEASDNDKFVALTFLHNAEVSTLGQFSLCQDTGTAIILGKKGQNIWTGVCDEEYLSHSVYDTYTRYNLRCSQNAPLDMYREVNTGCNLSAQIDLMATEGDEHKLLPIAREGGSTNKTYLYQETKALLTEERFFPFLVEKMCSLDTTACSPYRIVFVIGGTSAEASLKAVKLVSAKYYDELPTEGNELGHVFRDLEIGQHLLEATHEIGLGAQFGDKYFVRDIRVTHISRHEASCPVGPGVSCSAGRNVRVKINKDGLWIERLGKHLARLIPESMCHGTEGEVVKMDLNCPMDETRKRLSQYPVPAHLSLPGTIVVGRDTTHARLKERLDRGEELLQYTEDHSIYHAGPTKISERMPSGSFGPTTAGHMDPYVDLFRSHGGSLIMIVKGNRSQQVTGACKTYGGFCLGSIGGPATILAWESIRRVECLEYPELGMEAIWRIEVENFPVFVLVDDKGNDFFQQIRQCAGYPRG